MEDHVVVARVQVQRQDGRVEEWALPLRVESAHPHRYRSRAFLPLGAKIIETTVEVLPVSSGTEVLADQRQLPNDWRETTVDPVEFR